MDSVLTARRPRLTDADAVGIGATTFGVPAATARDLGSERDRTFALLDETARAGRGAEGLQRLRGPGRARHGGRRRRSTSRAVDPGLRVALPWRPVATGDPGPARRTTIRRGCAPRGGTATSRTGSGSTTSCRATAASRRPTCPTPRSSRGARRRPPRPGAARLRPPQRAPDDAWDVQHALSARAMLERHRATRARARVVARCSTRSSARGHAGLAAAARAGRPHRPHRRQHAHRRRRARSPGSSTSAT